MVSTEKVPRQIWRFIFHVIEKVPYRPKILTLLTCFIAATVVCVDMYMMYMFKVLVDNISVLQYENIWLATARPFITIGLCCIVHNILYQLQASADAYSIPEIQNQFRETLMEYAMKHSQAYFHDHFTGSLVNKINNVVQGYIFIFQQVITYGFIPILFAVISSSFILWPINISLVWIMWGVVFSLVTFGFWFSPKIDKASSLRAEREAAISGQLADTIGNISSVTNFMRQPYELNLLKRVQFPYIKAYRQLTFVQIFFWASFDILATILVVGFIFSVVYNWRSRHLTPGDVTICLAIAWDLWWRLGGLSAILSLFSSEAGRIQQALDEIILPYDIQEPEDARALNIHKGEIVFKDIQFTYDAGAAGKRTFDCFNLHIFPGQRVGLVGLSGAGKTTLCHLLLRHYNLQKGQILIDDQDISKVTQESLRQNIAVIPQDPTLFHRSLRDNIAYGAPEATEEEIISAAKAAQAHDFIMNLPQGYDTLVGERGLKLSGGQRQRIAIARAILKNAPILILDEATSALDSKTEKAIQDGLYSAMKGKTTLVVAHRLSTLVHLDRLIVLHNGKIVEDGTLKDLLTRNGYFTELWYLQTDGFLPQQLKPSVQ